MPGSPAFEPGRINIYLIIVNLVRVFPSTFAPTICCLFRGSQNLPPEARTLPATLLSSGAPYPGLKLAQRACTVDGLAFVTTEPDGTLLTTRLANNSHRGHSGATLKQVGATHSEEKKDMIAVEERRRESL